MLAEAQKVNFVDKCNKMQTLSTSQLPELIKSFELKVNQQKDVTQVKSGRPAAKMKLRDPREVLEIARLKVLISEMREKTMKMEAQLKSAAEKGDKERRNTLNPVHDNRKDEDQNEKSSLYVEKTRIHAVDRKGDNVELASALDNMQDTHDVKHMYTKGTNTQDFALDLEATTEGSHFMCTNEDVQDMSRNKTKKFLVEQELKFDKDAIELQAHLKNLQCDVNQMLLELSTKPDLQEELTATNEIIKGLQEDIKDDASTTKAQLLLLKQQFGELEKLKHTSELKELEFQKASQISSAQEAEVAELKKGNQELQMQKQELSKKLMNVLEKAAKIKPVTKDDVLASKAEVLKLMSTNVELQKKVEILQMSRFNEVEEVVYLRWVNACLQHDLDRYKSSCQNSDEIPNQTENCSPADHGKDNFKSRIRNSSCSSASNNNVLDYPALQNDSENMQEQNECNIMCSPQISSTYSSPTSTRYSRMNIHISPLAIPHGSVSSRHSSPLVSPAGRVDGSDSSPLTSPLPHVDGYSHLSLLENLHGHLKSSQASPQSSPHGVAKTKSGVLHSPQQQSPTNNYFRQSPDAYNPPHYSPGRMALERHPQKVADIQSTITFNGDRSSKLDATSYITARPHNAPRRSGRSFTRSTSTLSANSEGSVNRTQGSPQMQDRRTFMRSSSTLSADSDISTADHNLSTNTSLRRHSASSGMSLLDEYLHSTDTRSLNRPTSRFSAVLPHNRQFSNFKSVPFPTMKEVMEPFKREDSTGVKAHSFESHLDASNRVVAAFQRLSTSTPTKNTHRTFKDLSRQNSREDKAENEVQQPDKHDVHMTITRSTQADFICDLARAIQVMQYNSIEQVSAFVNWFDRQGEVEKQEFFKFPDFPRDKVEAMRRAIHEYEELKALETELHTYQDKLKGPADLSVQDMKTLLEKVENYIQGFKKARELAIVQFTELDIPTCWMLDSGMIAKIKQAALQLAQRFIKRVTKELTTQAEPGIVSRENSLLEAARFLLQVHNFAGGFDEKTASAFKLLQSQADLQNSNVVCCSATS